MKSSAATQGAGSPPFPANGTYRSLIVELVASSPGHTTGDHRRRHGTHASAPFSQRKLIQPINDAGGKLS